MTLLAEAVVRIKGDSAHLDKTLKSAAGSMQRAGKSMRSAGKTMTRRVSLPIAAVGAGVLKTAADFESSMNLVQATTRASSETMASLEAQAKELGATTQFSASQAGEAMFFLASAGFDTQETMGALPGVLDLAAAAGMDLSRAADLASNVLSGFNLEATELGRVNDTMARTFQMSNTNMEQLGQAMSFVAPVAAGLGMTVEETSAAIGLLGNAGIQGSRAGTTLRQALAKMVQPTSEQAAMWEELGVQLKDGEGKMRGMADIMADLEAAGAGAEEAVALFGTRAGPGMAALLAQGSEALRDMTEENMESAGTAAAVAEARMAGLGGAMKQLKSAAEAVALAIADSGLLEWATELALKVADFFRNLADTNPEVLKWGSALAVAAAAAGPLLAGLGLMVQGLGGVFSAVTLATAVIAKLTAAIPLLGGALKLLAGASGVGLAVAAFFAVVSAGAAIIENWDVLSFEAGRLGKVVKKMVGKIWDELVVRFDKIVFRLNENIETVKGFFKGMFQAVVGGSWVPDMIDGISREFDRLDTVMVAKARTATASTKTAFATLMDEVVAEVRRGMEEVADLNTAIPITLFEDLERTTDDLPESFGEAGDSAVDFGNVAERALRKVSGAAGGTLGKVLEVGQAFMRGGLIGGGMALGGMVIDSLFGESEAEKQRKQAIQENTEALRDAAKNMSDLAGKMVDSITPGQTAGFGSTVRSIDELLGARGLGEHVSASMSLRNSPVAQRAAEFFGVDLANATEEQLIKLRELIVETMERAGREASEALGREFGDRAAVLAGTVTEAELKLQAERREGIAELNRLHQAQLISREEFERFTAVVEGEFTEAMRSAQMAARRAAREFREGLAQRGLSALGLSGRASERAMRFGQEMELQDAMREGVSKGQLELMRGVQGIEREAAALNGALEDQTAQIRASADAQVALLEDQKRAVERRLQQAQQGLQAQQSTVQELQNVVKGLEKFGRQLPFSSFSPLSPFDRLTEARNRFQELSSAALSGSVKAAEQLPEAASTLLEAGKVFHGQGTGSFVNLFGEVRGAVDAVEGRMRQNLTTAQRTLRTMERAVRRLEGQRAQLDMQINETRAAADRQIAAAKARHKAELSKLEQILNALLEDTGTVRNEDPGEPITPPPSFDPDPPPPPTEPVEEPHTPGRPNPNEDGTFLFSRRGTADQRVVAAVERLTATVQQGNEDTRRALEGASLRE